MITLASLQREGLEAFSDPSPLAKTLQRVTLANAYPGVCPQSDSREDNWIDRSRRLLEVILKPGFETLRTAIEKGRQIYWCTIMPLLNPLNVGQLSSLCLMNLINMLSQKLRLNST
ncbi:hypothetical protein BCY86_02305 [Pajaroellobacter abortibovis]|uniref:Uncharacterized protein n=1 Tax=Pajaroellobacter abortibovis TaxID=1882918 RepID=A0A1L6MVU1_9BACT|nr:hypothetical protein BCY86_02305 [Pajaroellobacter abortibovis]